MNRHQSFADFVALLMRHRVAVLVVLLLAGIPAAVRTVLTYSNLRSDLEELLPTTAPSVEALREVRQRLPGLRHLGIVIDTGGPENVPAANRFVDDLAARIEKYPPELVGAVRKDIQSEREFAETYAFQLLEPGDVKRLREAVEERRDWEVTRAMDLNLLDDEEEPAPAIPVQEIRDKYEGRYGKPRDFPDDRFVSEDGQTVVLLVQASSNSTSYGEDKDLLTRVENDVADLGFPEAYAANMRIGYASEVATRVEETEGLETDLTVSGLIVLASVLGIIVWYFGSLQSLVVLGVPLMLGTLFAFAIVALPPFNIRYLNSNTAFLGSIVVGNGINTGIILLARYLEERRRGRDIDSAVRTAVESTWRPTLAAASAASAAYGSLMLTDFRGFNQFGWIGGLGMLSCWATTMVLVPCLVRFGGERLGFGHEQKDDSPGRRLTLKLLSHPKAVLVGTLLLATVGGIGVAHRMGSWVEYDFSKLRRRDSWESGERYWGARQDKTLGTYLTPTVVMAETEEQAKVIEGRIRKLEAEGEAGGLISSVRGASSVLREDRAESVEEAKLLQESLTPRMRGELSDEDRRLLDQALSPRALQPLTVDDVPSTMLIGLREKSGQVGRHVIVFPKLGSGTWDADRIAAFSKDLRQAATVDGVQNRVAGGLLLSSDITGAMRADGPRATAAALIVVLVVCLFAFRGGGVAASGVTGPIALSATAITSLFVGVLLMLGAMAWLGERINFTNFVALPITFGIGADYSINMLRRYQSEGGLDLRVALASTGGAVALCSATTILGFGSLLVAQNQALFSFGMFAVAGEVACLLTAILAVPAALQVIQRKAETQANTEPSS